MQKPPPLRSPISIHAPTKGATVQVHVRVAASQISIHAPTKGATSSWCPGRSGRCYFNPRSHEGSDLCAMPVPFLVVAISIHAPTKGATRRRRAHRIRTQHFNPRSHEGSDHFEASVMRVVSNFNPRSHEGSDMKAGRTMATSPLFQSTLPRRERLADAFGDPMGLGISIHAPTKGATQRQAPHRSSAAHFNPRSHEGSDQEQACHRKCRSTFQSTLPRRERPSVGQPIRQLL